MAKHILERGEHPVFYYGSAYGGSVEPHYVAAVFVLLGSTLAAYRVAMGGLVVLTITGVYAIARLAFGRSEAILAAAYLAVPPFFFLYKGLTSDGHYNAFNLFVVVTMITSLAIDRTLEIGRERWPLFVLLGFAAGVGWWINPITPPISAAAVAWLFLKKRPRPRVRNALQLVAGFVLGSAPWLIWNIRHGWVSLTSPELASVDGSGALHNLGEIVRDSLPLLAGGSRFRTTGSRDTFPFSRLAVGAALIVLFAPCLWRAVRGDRVLRLFVLAFGALVLTVIWSGRYVPTEPRLLFPFYVLAPPVIAAGFVRLGRKRPAALLAAACGAILAVGHGSSLLVEHRHLGNTATEVTGPLDELLGTLTTRGVRHVYTDYCGRWRAILRRRSWSARREQNAWKPFSRRLGRRTAESCRAHSRCFSICPRRCSNSSGARRRFLCRTKPFGSPGPSDRNRARFRGDRPARAPCPFETRVRVRGLTRCTSVITGAREIRDCPTSATAAVRFRTSRSLRGKR